MMRQLVGAGIELARRSALCSSNTTAIASGLRAAWAANSSRQGRGRDGTRRVVPLAQDGVALRRRSRMSRLADRLLGIRNRGLKQPHEPLRQRLDGCPIEQVGGVFDARHRCPAGAPSAARCSPRPSERSNLAVAVVDRLRGDASDPAAQAISAGALFCSASMTWNSGWRASERAGLSTSTSRSNGRS